MATISNLLVFDLVLMRYYDIINTISLDDRFLQVPGIQFAALIDGTSLYKLNLSWELVSETTRHVLSLIVMYPFLLRPN